MPTSITQLLHDLPLHHKAPQHIILTGKSGTGKSTLAHQLATTLASGTHPAYLLHLDPGRALYPSPPGTLTLARISLSDQSWTPLQHYFLGSMDALRFRSELISGALKLHRIIPPHAHLIIDTPGVLRGAIANELLSSLIQLLEPHHVLLLHHKTKDIEDLPLLSNLRALHYIPTPVQAHPEAKKLSKTQLHNQRKLQLDAYLSDKPHTANIPLEDVHVHHIIPEHQRPQSPHFAVALNAQGQQLGLVCLMQHTPNDLKILHAPTLDPHQIAALSFKDMILDQTQRITTHSSEAHVRRTQHGNQKTLPELAYTPRERPIYRVNFAGSQIRAGNGLHPTMVGHLFEDPMFVLRLAHRQRCIFLDLGEVRQVPTKLIHQTTDILLSHAHLDHFGDFPWLLRRMSGHTQAMRIFGPPGIIRRVFHMVTAFTWDRVEDRGPRFDIHEIHSDHIKRAKVQAGYEEPFLLEDQARLPEKLILEEPRIRISAITLDHGGLESIAYRIEEPNKFGVRGNILKERGWPPGPWLGTLKHFAAQRRFDELIAITDTQGHTHSHRVQELHDDLLIVQPGQKIVYATDFATDAHNHAKLVEFAHRADLLICEASFAEEDRDQAERTGHMCARNTAQIALDAQVNLLAPFHLSVRYESRPEVVYKEILSIFERTLIPQDLVVYPPLEEEE